jgi:hypothetical protein
MDFNYSVIENRNIEIDFQDIFDYIKSEDSNLTTAEIYNTFLDNAAWYLRSIYKCEDLDEDTNEYEITDLTEKWEYWLNEIFGENWDEV